MTTCVRKAFPHRLVFIYKLISSSTRTNQMPSPPHHCNNLSAACKALKSSHNYLLLISKQKTITSVDYFKHNSSVRHQRSHRPHCNPVKLSTDRRLISENTGTQIGIWKWRGLWGGLVALVSMSDCIGWEVSNLVFLSWTWAASKLCEFPVNNNNILMLVRSIGPVRQTCDEDLS